MGRAWVSRSQGRERERFRGRRGGIESACTNKSALERSILHSIVHGDGESLAVHKCISGVYDAMPVWILVAPSLILLPSVYCSSQFVPAQDLLDGLFNIPLYLAQSPDDIFQPLADTFRAGSRAGLLRQ